MYGCNVKIYKNREQCTFFIIKILLQVFRNVHVKVLVYYKTKKYVIFYTDLMYVNLWTNNIE